MPDVPTLTMNDGRTIPQLGFGVFQIPQDETETAVTTALEAGYRLIDTAQGYQNEEGVGAALAASDVAREDVFITTKLTNSEQGYDATLKAFDASMEKLRLDVLDLFLIHWPLPMFDLYTDTWKAFVRLQEEGRITSIGVSNFEVEHFEKLAAETGVVPAVNQIELHPQFPQHELRAYHAEHGILTESWGPIGQGKGLLENPHIQAVATKTGKTPAQVVLRWHLQLGLVVIPKSVTPSRIVENIEVFDFTLDDEDLAAIAQVDEGTRLGPDPRTFDRR
ncbi:Aldo/keto reductase [Friedmanniella luteola]|uniref:Aldo/keto reductase n=1 Tax=Friedmanniella luteola TaxID=546871 RepID=A0A1H1V0H2_9ACTN|nr:aldo/keto reductase [Friedmanniella luteola]SDS78277.1 Aldo/keto reductase [Friedmanniella luteola]